MATRFGFNDLGGDLTPLLQSYRPSAFVAFDAGRARWLKDTFPEALVIYRHMPDGGNLHADYGTPLAAYFRKAFDAAGGDLRLVYQLGNEPTEFVEKLAEQTLAALDVANEVGATVAVLGFSVCHPDAGDWYGPLLPVLRKLAGSRHYLLLHEYFLEHGQEWCIGQVRNANAAADAAGIARPQIILGEYGYDLPGWKGSQRERGLLDEAYAAALVKGWNEVYAPAGVRAACIYAWGRGDVWQDFDVSDAGAFLTALKAATLADPAPIPNVEPTEPEEPTPIPDPIIFSRAELVRWRQKMAGIIVSAEYMMNILDILLFEEP